MRFAIISPTAGLQRFSTLSHTHLLLAHVQNPFYWKFYEELSQDPRELIILDNSAYEGKMNMDYVFKRLESGRLRISSLVMPDYLGLRSDMTYRSSIDFVRRWRHRLPFDLMYVPQFDGTIEDYQCMKRHLKSMVEDFGIMWFGLPRLTAERGYSRGELCLYIKRLKAEWDHDPIYVHALGMCAGSLRELAELDACQVDSVDSSAPVWRGWNGYDIEKGDLWKQSGTECDFDVHPDSLNVDNEQLILSNLRKVGVNAK